MSLLLRATELCNAKGDEEKEEEDEGQGCRPFLLADRPCMELLGRQGKAHTSHQSGRNTAENSFASPLGTNPVAVERLSRQVSVL